MGSLARTGSEHDPGERGAASDALAKVIQLPKCRYWAIITTTWMRRDGPTR